MSSTHIISKEKYLELMEMQREHLGRMVDIAKENLNTFESGLAHQLQSDFEQVEVAKTNDRLSFKIVEKNK